MLTLLIVGVVICVLFYVFVADWDDDDDDNGYAY